VILGLIDNRGITTPRTTVLTQAYQNGHFEGYPFLALSQLMDDSHPRGPTASQIAGGSWRQVVLTGLLDYYLNPGDVMPMLRGSVMHLGLEAIMPKGANIMKERRLEGEFAGRPISGQVDLYYPDYARLEDWKTCKTIPKVIKNSHLIQLAIYAWLLKLNGFPVESAAINYANWYEFASRGWTEIKGEAIPVADHPIFKEEAEFEKVFAPGWDVISKGFQEHIIPSTQHCVLSYCTYCPVKWACDLIHVDGEQIRPEVFDQEEAIFTL
jgi:hypothetical protein